MATAQERDFNAEAISLIRGIKSATLATAQENSPFAALVTPAFMADLSPVLLLSTLSGHTRQLLANPAAALLLVGTPTDDNPQTAPRLCLMGKMATSTAPDVRATYLTAHPYAAQYADFQDFSFWRMELAGAHYVGGFAAAARLDVVKLKAGLLKQL